MLDADGNQMAPWAERTFGPGSAKGCWGIFAAIPLVLIGWIIFNPVEPTKSVPTSSTAIVDNTPASGLKEIDTKVDGENNLKAALKDGSSALFRNEFVSALPEGAQVLCGEVNSKSSFGGFTGFKRFIASPNPTAPNVIEGEGLGDDDVSPNLFRKAYSAACSNPVKAF